MLCLGLVADIVAKVVMTGLGVESLELACLVVRLKLKFF